jgi:hypothetical protein
LIYIYNYSVSESNRGNPIDRSCRSRTTLRSARVPGAHANSSYRLGFIHVLEPPATSAPNCAASPLTIGPSPTPKARTHLLPRRQPRRWRRSRPHPHPQLRIVFLIRGHPSTTCDCSIPFVPQTCLRNWHHEASPGERRRPRMCPGQQHTSTRNAPELTIETLRACLGNGGFKWMEED